MINIQIFSLRMLQAVVGTDTIFVVTVIVVICVIVVF
jgi:hypothetical protein